MWGAQLQAHLFRSSIQGLCQHGYDLLHDGSKSLELSQRGHQQALRVVHAVLGEGQVPLNQGQGALGLMCCLKRIPVTSLSNIRATQLLQTSDWGLLSAKQPEQFM